MRALFALVLLGALAAPAAAHDDCRTYRGWYGRTYAYPRFNCRRPYWHHRYYARFGYQRPYLYYRQLRTYTYGFPAWGGCGGGAFRYGNGYGYGGYDNCYGYGYYPAYVSVAPVYSRLGTALTLDDAVFSRPDADGLPRARTAPVGARFLVDAR